MPDYSAWPERKLAIAALRLDEENPRIPSGGEKLSQRQLIEELVHHENVYDLARDIAMTGFVPVESLIGLDEGDKTIILEGNRRLAALKLLDNAQLAPSSHLQKFKQVVAKRTAPAVTRVRVLIARSREAAAVLILQKHTRDQVQRWSPLMQSRFYRGLMRSGVSIDDLAKQHGVTAGEVRDFLRIDSMYELARSLKLPDAVRSTVNDPREFPASVLQRLLEMTAFQKFLGLQFEADGSVSAKAAPKDFQKAYTRVLTDIAEEKINTRTVNTVKNAEEYIKKNWSGVTPAATRRAYSMADLKGEERPSTELAESGAASPSPSGPRASAIKVIPSGIRCTLRDERVREVFKELKALHPKKYPNGHAVLLRVLLELGVAHWADKKGLLRSLREQAKAKGKPADWAPTLTQMLRALLADPEFSEVRPLARKALTKLIDDGKNSLISVDTLDGFVHNNFVWPSEAEIRRIWKALEDVLVIVLVEPTTKPSTAKR